MGLFSSKSDFPWTPLTSAEQLSVLMDISQSKPVVIYKHSTRCNISMMVKARLEKSWKPDGEKCEAVYLDLLAHRDLSNSIAEKSGVRHESPQVIIFSKGEAVYNASHGEIDADDIEQKIQTLR
jgi:bacillithiol system protein YtxJ